jgi:hypothetical protein
MTTTHTLLVRKNQLADTRWTSTEDRPLADGQIRVRVDNFSLTANNITYAAMGDAMSYWRFFPSGDDAWGIVPVWGFGTVVQSTHADVPVGEQLYGYWPTATSVVLQPERVTPEGFRDGASHRAELHGVYNQYLRTRNDPLYRAETEGIQSLLRPLFTTSWLIDDFLADNGFFDTSTLLLSSASSKTAYGTAFQLAQRSGLDIIGLTSEGNHAFCESLGCYTRVLSYEQLDQIAANTPCVYVDFAGNSELRRHIHTRFNQLRYSCAIGATHVTELRGGKGLPGPTPTMFFAPAQIKKRRTDWGPGVLEQRLLEAWQAFTARVSDPQQPWLVVEHRNGQDALQTGFARLLGGQSDPRAGMTFSPFATP